VKPLFARHEGVGLHARLHGPPTGIPLLLVHGWPQDGSEWDEVAWRLAHDHRVVCPDLRGMGLSDKATGGYDASTQAGDLAAVLDACGITAAHVAAHDIGGPVAAAFCARFPGRALSLSLFEAPLWGLSPAGAPDLLAAFWHLRFFQEPDIAPSLMSGREEAFLVHFMRHHAWRRDALSLDAIRTWAQALALPGGLRGGFGHYRAIPETAAQIAAWAEQGLGLPAQGWGGAAVMQGYVVAALRMLVPGAEGGIVPDCGHWIAEERPDFVVERLRAFTRPGAAVAAGAGQDLPCASS
jgi:pimeloyl-ACP methyl ester carboxylesterase